MPPMWTRRALFKTGGLALFSAGLTPRFLARAAAAVSEPGAFARRKTLVTIFLRGAMDGLAAVPLLDDPALRRLRPGLAVGAARSEGATLLDLDGRHGLHPALGSLLPFWQDGRLAIVHAVGSPNPTRSHFDAQDFMEAGTPWRKSTPSGWLNRTAQALGGSPSPLRAVAIGAELPRSLYGEAPALAIDDLGRLDLRIPADAELAAPTLEALGEMYRHARPGALRGRGREMFEALDLIRRRDLEADRREHGAGYPDSALGESLHQIAFLLRAGVGLEIACAESNGWDTHVAQGGGEGTFARLARDLALSMRAFWEDIEPFHEDVVVLTMTEFGRTVAENGSGGTDHGHGSVLFTLGNRVDGGKVHGRLESIEPEALFEGRDLPVTTDFRAVFSDVVGKLYGLRDDARIFPGWDGGRLPILW